MIAFAQNHIAIKRLWQGSLSFFAFHQQLGIVCADTQRQFQPGFGNDGIETGNVRFVFFALYADFDKTAEVSDIVKRNGNTAASGYLLYCR